MKIRGLAFVAVPLSLVVGCGTSQSDKTQLLHDNAYEACKHFVSNQLKAPATASYPNFFTNTTDITLNDNGGGAFEVLSQVDSDNGFGAKLRSTFDCNVTTSDGGKNWQDAGTTVHDGGG
jgi:major membrane immunogen (membrane-anchored lipoprotein)